MKAWRILSGLLSIVFYTIVDKQAKLARLAEALGKDSESKAGSAGQIVAVLLLVGGILSLVFFKTRGVVGTLILTSTYAIAAAVGFANAGFFKDLNVWSGWCLICALMALASLAGNRKKKETKVGTVETAGTEEKDEKN